MALVDTGLGWYAEGDWLTNQAVAIGSIDSSVPGIQGTLIPQTSGDIYSAAFIYKDSFGNNRCLSAAQVSGNDPVYLVGGISASNNIMWTFYSASAFTFRYYLDFGSTLVGWDSGRLRTAHLDSATGMYAYCEGALLGNLPLTYVNGSGTITQMPELVQTTSPDSYEVTERQICWAVYNSGGGGTSIAFAKSAPGYSVVCMVKWKQSIGGDVLCSPFLISSNTNYTYFSENGSVVSVPASEHRFNNMTFYMRKLTDIALDGTETLTSNFPVLDYSSSAPVTDNLLFTLIAAASSLGVGFPPADEDPYADGNTSGPGGGGGTFDDSSDTIVDSTQPTYSFASTGFSRIYNPDLTQINLLANYLWTDPTFLQTVINHLKQLIENPMNAIISLSMLPVSIPNGTPEEVKVMYIPTGVSMPPATTQFVDVDCGSILIDKYYGSALDYNPYTKISLFLPFIGMIDVDTDEVMGQTLYVKYRVDIVAGTCVAKVFVGDTTAASCLYQFTGDCAISMPMNSADFSGYRAAFISAAKAVTTGIAAAGSGIAAAMEANELTHAFSVYSEGLGDEVSGQAMMEAGKNIASQVKAGAPTASFADASKNAAVNTVGSVISGKVQIQHSSGFGGNSGMLGVRRPYVIIKRPNMCNPQEYGKYNGRPCEMYLSLGTLSGYTEVQNVQLTGFSATNPELSEIAELLRGGVIL